MQVIVELIGKETHADKHEQFLLLKFDAPDRETQEGLALRDHIANLQIALTPEAGHALVPVLERHLVGIVPHLAAFGPDEQPEIFVEGRRYVLTIEPADAKVYPVGAAQKKGPFGRFFAKLTGR